MFVQTEFVGELGALLRHRGRWHEEPEVWAAPFRVVEGETIGAIRNMKSIGHASRAYGSVGAAIAMGERARVPTRSGPFSIRSFSIGQRVPTPPGRSRAVAFWTVVASSRDAVLDLIDTHHDRKAFDRAASLGVDPGPGSASSSRPTPEEAVSFQRLASRHVFRPTI